MSLHVLSLKSRCQILPVWNMMLGSGIIPVLKEYMKNGKTQTQEIRERKWFKFLFDGIGRFFHLRHLWCADPLALQLLYSHIFALLSHIPVLSEERLLGSTPVCKDGSQQITKVSSGLKFGRNITSLHGDFPTFYFF